MKNWIKATLSILVLLFFAIGLAACNAEESQFSPQEVVNAALKEADEQISYQAEYTMHFSSDEEDLSAKEWVSKDGKRRAEITSGNGKEKSIAVNDGEQLSVYDESSNTVNVMKFSSEDMAALTQQSPRKQAEQLLNMIKDTHDFTNKGEEKIAGRDTFHISAKAKDDKALIGDQEVWIDKENWMVLKSISSSNDLTLTQEYTNIDLDPKFEDNTFVLDYPEDATVEVMDEDSMAPDEVTMEEAREVLGSFYMVPENGTLVLEKITRMEGIEDRPEFSLDYQNGGMPAFSLIVFKQQSNTVDFGQLGNEEKITIRGVEGTKTDMNGFRTLDWQEDGLQYTIIIDNPELDFTEVEQYAEEMVPAEEA